MAFEKLIAELLGTVPPQERRRELRTEVTFTDDAAFASWLSPESPPEINDHDSERPTIPSPPGSTEVRGDKEFMLTPACTDTEGCTQPRMFGHTRCVRHSSTMIPAIKKCSRCRALFAPGPATHPMCPDCQKARDPG